MKLANPSSLLGRSMGPRGILVAVASILLLGACAGGSSDLPDPRTIVIRSGARLYPESSRMEEISAWYGPQMENIELDPTFLIQTVDRDTPAYPWESLVIVADTAKIGVEMNKSVEASTAYNIYAHLRLMKVKGRIEEFLPGSGGQEGFLLERAILARVADVWYFGRGAFQAQAYPPLEELLFCNEAGYLDAFLLTARAQEFDEELEAWLRDDPEGQERFRGWFVETFDREPPGFRDEG
jgi:hypothetical protein